MKKLFLFSALIFCIACGNKKKENKIVETPKKIKVIDKDADITIAYQATYLNPQSKPDVLQWKPYLDLQSKIYQLKKTNTKKLKQQLDDIDKAIVAVKQSNIPKPLQTASFHDKILFLEDLNLNALDSLEEDISIEQLSKNLLAVMNAYKATKNEIRNIYTQKNNS